MADFAKEAMAQNINFVAKFTTDLHNLMNVLGKTQVQVMAPGTAYKIYKSSGTLSASAVAAKAEIPDSGYAMGEPTVVALTYSKYRNLTSIEDIGSKGYEVAVGGSNTAMLKDVQKGIRTSIFTAIATGTGTATAATFQAKVAKAAAYISKKFEDEACTPVFFANPDDVYDYLGAHSITVESNFGLSYLENFMGIGNVVIDSNVAAGTVIGTATENLDLVAASIGEIPGLDMYTDESGIIAVHNGATYSKASLETVTYSGVGVQPVYLDRIVKVTTAA